MSLRLVQSVPSGSTAWVDIGGSETMSFNVAVLEPNAVSFISGDLQLSIKIALIRMLGSFKYDHSVTRLYRPLSYPPPLDSRIRPSPCLPMRSWTSPWPTLWPRPLQEATRSISA